MISIFGKTSRRGLVIFLVILTMILTTIIPVWAEEVPTPAISHWAVGDLTEGERYGIFPIEWYYDNFTTEISQERLESLLTDTASKIEELGLTRREEFSPVSYNGDNTRGDIIIRLYNILGQYELSIGDTPVNYMQERGILVGTNNGLNLDQECTTEQAVIFATRLIQDTYAQVEAGSKGLAWKVENDGTIIYFLGSIHIGNSNIYPVSKKLKQAFIDSDALIVEANLFDQQGGMDYFLEKATYQDGTTLKDNISEETYEKALKVFEGYGYPEEVFSQFKPWSVANDLGVISMTDSENIQQGAESANLGVDMYFLTNALLLQKPVMELEGIRFQADLFDGLSAETQESYLNSVLDSILEPNTDEAPDAAMQLDEWLIQWKNGDIEGFSSSYTQTTEESKDDELTRMLFGERDKNMTEKIVDLLESEHKATYFVVVGAGHLAQPNTVLDQLREEGYDIEIFQ